MTRALCNAIEQYPKGKVFHRTIDLSFQSENFSFEQLLSGNPRPSVELWNDYYVLTPRSGADLCSVLLPSLYEAKCLVVLPPLKYEEKTAYLSQLPPKEILPVSIRLIVFTSGSMGEAKAVLHTEESLFQSAKQSAAVFSSCKDIFCALPAWSMAGIHFQCLLPLVTQSTVTTSKEALFFLAPKLPEMLLRWDFSLFVLNPALVKILLQLAPESSVKTRFVSLSASLLEQDKQRFLLRFHVHLEEIYGMSESAGPLVCEGKSLGAELRLAEDHELLIKGPQLFWGYSVKQQLVPAPEWFPTGDIVSGLDAVKVLSRKKELINLAGRKIPPRLIEGLLRNIDGVKDAYVFGLPDSLLEEQIACVIELSEKKIEPRLAEIFAETFSQELLPKHWQVVDAIPRSANGKVHRQEVLKLFRQ